MTGGYCAARVLKSPHTWDTSSRWAQEGAVLCQPRSQERLGSEAAVPWFTWLWKDVWGGCKQFMLTLYCLLTYQINIWPVRKCRGYRPQHYPLSVHWAWLLIESYFWTPLPWSCYKKNLCWHYLSSKITKFCSEGNTHMLIWGLCIPLLWSTRANLSLQRCVDMNDGRLCHRTRGFFGILKQQWTKCHVTGIL